MCEKKSQIYLYRRKYFENFVLRCNIKASKAILIGFYGLLIKRRKHLSEGKEKLILWQQNHFMNT